MMMDDSLLFKVLVVGNAGVGKTSILNQYCYAKFDPSVNQTIGCDYNVKVLEQFQGKRIKLQLWDIAGQDRYAAVSKLYVKGAVGCIIVSDITDPDSLTAGLKWKEIIEENADMIRGELIPIILFQNKYDLVEYNERKEFQQIEYLEQFAKENHFRASFQVSAKSNIGIDKAVEILVSDILRLKAMELSKESLFRSSRFHDSISKSGRESILLTKQNQEKEKDKDSGCNC